MTADHAKAEAAKLLDNSLATDPTENYVGSPLVDRIAAALVAARTEERQRIRGILWSMPMLPIEAPDEQSQRRITHFVSRADVFISEIEQMPADLAEKVKRWSLPPAPTKEPTK